ncbi:MAG: hypothetical protein LQ341_001716 [Variospora aurantia]|nr:MAG: hypothetical protein LQ341_001716 [Variospora aurantia]
MAVEDGEETTWQKAEAAFNGFHTMHRAPSLPHAILIHQRTGKDIANSMTLARRRQIGV